MTEMMAPDEDHELVNKARSSAEGDSRAFNELVDRYKERVVANCRYLSRSANDAEDLAQEVFVKAFFALPRFEGRSTFKTWLRRIKVNHTLNHLRKQGGRNFVGMDDAQLQQPEQLSVRPAAVRSTIAREQRERIGQVLDGLSDNLRIPLVMRDMDQLSYQEIADSLGIGLSAVKMRIKRGREEFRERYAELETQEERGSQRSQGTQGSQRTQGAQATP